MHLAHHKTRGLVNHTAALTGSNLIARSDYEKHDDNTIKAIKRVIDGLFSSAGNELSLKKYLWVKVVKWHKN